MTVEMKRSSDTKIRVTVDLTKQLYARLERLESAVGATSKADVVRDALRLYEFISDRTAEGWEFAIRRGGEEKALVLFSVGPVGPTP